MTKKFGKTVSISSTDIQRSFGVEVFDNVEELQFDLSIAKSTLEKLGITEKTKTIDLNWVRDDYTANKILEWWCKNSNRQRARIKAGRFKIKAY